MYKQLALFVVPKVQYLNKYLELNNDDLNIYASSFSF